MPWLCFCVWFEGLAENFPGPYKDEVREGEVLTLWSRGWIRFHLGTEMTNRPKGYISRTIGWDQYPHGRCGDSCNPSYGALTDYQFMRPCARDKKLIEEWVVPLKSIEDIYERFRMCCIGKLRSNPWSELDGLQPETKIINEQLERINTKDFLTINSQPAVNGEKSDSPTIGWGGPGGYVYQKANVEFFCSKEKLDTLVDKQKVFLICQTNNQIRAKRDSTYYNNEIEKTGIQ
ncbi:hypothetical protein VNO80_15937 [Phaseolus coccineus]|uniref:MTHFR SAM-binding regulatory domain-containing protein n=1 Tax=Phaseolus coccineus TaxID=3886 RepID=A0AAN9MR57_PHACN